MFYIFSDIAAAHAEAADDHLPAHHHLRDNDAFDNANMNPYDYNIKNTNNTTLKSTCNNISLINNYNKINNNFTNRNIDNNITSINPITTTATITSTVVDEKYMKTTTSEKRIANMANNFNYTEPTNLQTVITTAHRKINDNYHHVNTTATDTNKKIFSTAFENFATSKNSDKTTKSFAISINNTTNNDNIHHTAEHNINLNTISPHESVASDQKPLFQTCICATSNHFNVTKHIREVRHFNIKREVSREHYAYIDSFESDVERKEYEASIDDSVVRDGEARCNGVVPVVCGVGAPLVSNLVEVDTEPMIGAVSRIPWVEEKHGATTFARDFLKKMEEMMMRRVRMSGCCIRLEEETHLTMRNPLHARSLREVLHWIDVSPTPPTHDVNQPCDGNLCNDDKCGSNGITDNYGINEATEKVLKRCTTLHRVVRSEEAACIQVVEEVNVEFNDEGVVFRRAIQSRWMCKGSP